MSGVRLLHLADVHLGVEAHGRLDPETGLNSRLLDFTRRLDEAIDHAIAAPVHLVVFAGDAFRTRDPTPTQQREFARRIRRLADAGIPTFLLVGNHDLPAASGRANALDIYETLGVPGVVVGRLPDLHRIETAAGPIQIVALPWLRRSALLADQAYRALTVDEARRAIEDAAATAISAAVERRDRTIPTILCAHVSVEGAVWGSERSVMLGEDVVLPRSTVANPAFDYVALGHVHRHQVLYEAPPVIYSGSIERVDFGEEDDPKGFIVAEVALGASTWRFHPVAARRFVTVRARPTSLDPTAEILREIERVDVADAIVRLAVETTPEVDSLVDWALVRRALATAHAIAGIQRSVARPERRSGGIGNVEALSWREALALYLKLREVPEERREVLLRFAGTLRGDAA